jgi:hypothetical protein
MSFDPTAIVIATVLTFVVTGILTSLREYLTHNKQWISRVWHYVKLFAVSAGHYGKAAFLWFYRAIKRQLN